MSIISVSGLRKEFGGLVAVDDVNFEARDGEFISILGPSGSGKSTILRMIAGFESPSSGSIEIEGSNITKKPPFERDINMVFQSLGLFPHLTVAENIGYGLVESGVNKDKRQKKIKDILEVVELAGYGDRSIDKLSGGEQQRVALARAIVNQPKIVLFDEPLASLDRKLRQHMQFELQRIQEETEITFLYVTHDQEVAMAVSDRMLVLNEGKMEQLDEVQEIYNIPDSRFVAEFIGDVNVFPGNVTKTDNEKVVIEMDDQELIISNELNNKAENVNLDIGKRISIGVRPSNLSIGEPPGDNTIAVDGTIGNRGFAGEKTTYTVDTSYGSTTIDSNNHNYNVNDDITVWWGAKDVYLFEPDELSNNEATQSDMVGKQ